MTRQGGQNLIGCAFGFNAITSSGSNVFFTNSHCTKWQFSLSGVTEAYQIFGTNPSGLIGLEWIDPAGWDCTPWWQPWLPDWCRNSDAAAFIHASQPDSIGFGFIARTLSRSTGPLKGSTTINPSNPRFQITSKALYPGGGSVVNKMGPRGGWTYGGIIDTCETPSFDSPGGAQ